jgi:hypothetical protein
MAAVIVRDSVDELIWDEICHLPRRQALMGFIFCCLNGRKVLLHGRSKIMM